MVELRTVTVTVNFCIYGRCTIIYFVSITVLTVCLKCSQYSSLDLVLKFGILIVGCSC